jgi:hypothetical protein
MVEMMTEVYQGSCLCAAVSYALSSTPKAVSHCHCGQCKKGHGAIFATYGSVPRSDLQILSGAAAIKSYSSSDGVLRQFCRHCGSTLFWARSTGEYADWTSVALATLDTPFTPQKQHHVHLASKVAWYEY